MMKRLYLFITLSLAVSCGFASDVMGYWKGEVMTLPIVFHVFGKDGAVVATLDSPAQGAKDIPCGKIVVKGDSIMIDMPLLGAAFKGEYEKSADVIKGIFSQGREFAVVLERTTADASLLYRPQEPKPPFFYNSREVTFSHDGLTFAGTLTTPMIGRSHPAVVLVSGSGAQNRNEEIFGHKPFAVIAHHLTLAGFAVLRYDDRGIGGSSAGTSDDTTRDFADDALAAVDFLKTCNGIDSAKIGILGHSEGGLIAFMCAARRPADISFVVSLAGALVKGRDLMVRQNQMIAQLSGTPLSQSQLKNVEDIFDAIDSVKDEKQLRKRLFGLMSKDGNHASEQIKQSIDVMTSPWYTEMVRTDPAQYISRTQSQVFALNGEWDVQVDAHQNINALRELLPNAHTKIYPRLNHLFQTAASQAESFNYGAISQTISPEVLTDISKWISDVVTKK